MRWLLLRRLLWTIFAVWLVLSGTFVLFAYTPDPNEALIRMATFDPSEDPNETVQEQKEAIAAYREARNYDEPVLDRYANWMVGYTTLNWGYSHSRGKPVIDVIVKRAPVTLTYLLPAILLALVGGLGIGLYAATHQGGLVDSIGTSMAYVGFGLPIFFLGEALAAVAVSHFGLVLLSVDERYGLWTVHNIDAFVLPMIVMMVNLLAIQLRYARAESLEYVPADFVKTLRASGASMRDIARHILRNAAPPLVSLFFTEVLTVLFVSVYVVEVVFELPGLGLVAYQSISDRDIGLVLATTLIPVLIGIVGNLIQDIVYTVLDPRIKSNER
jgi:peptide/nickel transport system permease protein